MRDEIMKVEMFKFSEEVWKKIIDLFRQKTTNIREYYDVFDLAMQELYEHNIELYFSMIRYLFNSECNEQTDNEIDTLEFYALCEEEKRLAPWMDTEREYTERALEFLQDTFYTALDEYVEKLFNASKDDFDKLLEYCTKKGINIIDVYAQAIKQCVRNKAFSRAFVYLAKNIYFETSEMIFKKGNRFILRKEATA